MSSLQNTPPPRHTASRLQVLRLALVLSVLVECVACDQTTKRMAAAHLPEGRRLSFLHDCVRLEHVRNPGSFLSLGARLPERARALIFTWGVGALVVAALVVAFRRRTSTRTACTAALIAAGGAGNLWDRVVSGGWVTDFMNVGVGPLRTGIFNMADLAIVAGVALLALSPAADDTRRGT
jgi:signal peptidase II